MALALHQSLTVTGKQSNKIKQAGLPNRQPLLKTLNLLRINNSMEG